MRADTSGVTGTKPLRPRPNFICIGPKRSATTWLADQLKFHRDIWLTPIQELNYLDGGFGQHRDKAYLRLRWTRWEIAKRVIRNKGPGVIADHAFLRVARQLIDEHPFDLDGYARLFAPAGRRVSGDISPMYASMTQSEIARARPVLETAHVFMLARDPVQRFWSELSMHARKQSFGAVDYASLAVARSFFEDPERQRQHLLSDITQRWRAGLGANRLEVIFFDDIIAHPEGALRTIVAAIGADWGKRLPGLAPDRNRKQGRTALEPDTKVRAAVAGWFGDELGRCADLFGAHGAAWRARY